MLVSLSHLSDLTGFDRRTVARRLAALPSKVEGKARLFESSQALRLLYVGTGDGTLLDPQQQKARLDKARADVVELDLAERRGQVLRASEVTATWVAQVTIAKGRLLSIPSRVAPEVLSLGDLKAVEAVVRNHIYQALEDLSRDDDGGPTAVAKVD